MNAGAYGGEFKDIVKDVTYMDAVGNIETIQNNECNFSYRHSLFSNKNYIILEATLMLQKGNINDIKSKMEEYAESRRTKQPINMPSAGSTFKRGEDYITAKLIDECGLKGYSIGDAEVSNIHAGFVVNKGNATAKSITNFKNSVAANGGYYIGRYEARTATARNAAGNALTQITEKGTENVYNYVTQLQAAQLSQNMYNSCLLYTSDAADE
mgnify:CR=1 FL=1